LSSCPFFLFFETLAGSDHQPNSFIQTGGPTVFEKGDPMIL